MSEIKNGELIQRASSVGALFYSQNTLSKSVQFNWSKLEMEQEPLFMQDEFEALKVDVARAGGAQVIGDMLWPDKGPIKAGEHLNNCLSRDRREKLDYSQIIFIKAEARKVGSFAAQRYENEVIGLAPPVAIEPEDEAAKLQRQFIESQKAMDAILKRMERLSLPSQPSVRSVG